MSQSVVNEFRQNKPEAIILIHGIDGKTPGDILSKLERGITDSSLMGSVAVKVPLKVGESEARVLEVSRKADGSQNKHLHLYELFWGDTIDKITDLGIRNQIGRGFSLIIYWICTPFLKARNRYIALGGSFAALGMLIWWYGLVITALGIAIPLTNGEERSISDFFAELSSKGGFWSYPLWVIQYATSVYMGLAAMILTTPMTTAIESIVNILHFCQRYMFEENLRHRIWKRLNFLITELDATNQYSRITVLSHSFGTVIHVNWMADYKGNCNTLLRHITMGGPLAVMALRSKVILNDMIRALSNSYIKSQEWTDFYSKYDWMCTEMPDSSDERSYKTVTLRNADRIIDSRHLSFDNTSFKKQILGSHHTEYFQNEEVIEKLIH